MLNIVVPMAGAGSRFKKAGFNRPKPLIEVGEKTMIEIVIDNLKPKIKHKFIFICQKDHLDNYPIERILKNRTGDCEIVEVEGLTDGAACTVLKAENLINNEYPLMIANSDQFIENDINDYIEKTEDPDIDGMIMTMTANDAKWSYVLKNSKNEITKIVEKKVISNEATVGIYNFRNGKNFVTAAKEMIRLNLRENNEFYVAPVYNILIKQGLRFKTLNIGNVGSGMHGLGVPEDLEAFLKSNAGTKYKKS